MNPVTMMKAYVAVGALCVTIVGAGLYNSYQRSIGAANALAGVALARAESLQTILDTSRARLKVDTVRTIRRLVQSDTVIQRLVDTARVLHVDTVNVPVTVLVQADSAIHACRETIAECGKVATMERARADAINQAFTNYKRAQSSRWMPRVGAGVAAGVNTQGKPDAVAGLTFGWTIR